MDRLELRKNEQIYEQGWFWFHLPRNWLPNAPLWKCDASKLLIVNRETGEMQDKHLLLICWNLWCPLSWTTPEFSLPAPMVKSGDRRSCGTFLLKNTSGDEWVLAKPAKRLKVWYSYQLGDGPSAVVTEELTHGDVLSALNTKNFP